MKSKAVFTRFCILQGAYWAFQAAMVGYYTAYVISCGIPNKRIKGVALIYTLSVVQGCSLGEHPFPGVQRVFAQ